MYFSLNVVLAFIFSKFMLINQLYNRHFGELLIASQELHVLMETTAINK